MTPAEEDALIAALASRINAGVSFARWPESMQVALLMAVFPAIIRTRYTASGRERVVMADPMGVERMKAAALLSRLCRKTTTNPIARALLTRARLLPDSLRETMGEDVAESVRARLSGRISKWTFTL